jgi:hypothetical protein
MKKETQRTTLPTKLIEDIELLQLTKPTYNKVLKLIDVIKKKSYQGDSKLYTSYIPLSSTYLIKALGVEYNKITNKLVNTNILRRNDSYIVGKKCKQYAINSKYFINKEMETKSIQYEIKTDWELTKEEKELDKLFRKDFGSLKIVINKLYTLTDNAISKLSINDFRVNEQILEGSFELHRENGYSGYITRAKALELAKKLNVSVIQNKKKFYLMDETEFINAKKNTLTLAYYDSIDKINKKYYRARRNNTNGRLDTNITNMCTLLIDEVANDNDLVNIDLANSQFAVLSYILPDNITGNDVDLFKELSATGTLYEHIQTVLNLNTRKEAKIITFELLFGSVSNTSKGLKQLKQEFPTVIKWINDYKRSNDEHFAVMLQKTESNIFIDDIYYELKKQDMFCLTKHDSVMVKKEDEQYIREFITQYFDTIGFNGTLK